MKSLSDDAVPQFLIHLHTVASYMESTSQQPDIIDAILKNEDDIRSS